MSEFECRKIEVEDLPWATWMMTSNCNAAPYCPYCIQGLNKADHPTTDQILSIINGLNILPDVWMISLLGGEIMDIPDFAKIIFPEMVQKTSHYYSFTSNLKAPLDDFKMIFMEGRQSLIEVRFSYHSLLWKQPKEFIDKLKNVVNLMGVNTVQFKVALPLVQKALLEIEDIIIPELKVLRIPYFFQKLKIRVQNGRLEPYKYKEKDLSKINKLLQDNKDGERMVLARSYQGKYCLAGVRMITIMEDGSVYRCFDFAERKESAGYLGNLAQGQFTLDVEPVRCPFSLCGCGAAAYRNLIER